MATWNEWILSSISVIFMFLPLPWFNEVFENVAVQHNDGERSLSEVWVLHLESCFKAMYKAKRVKSREKRRVVRNEWKESSEQQKNVELGFRSAPRGNSREPFGLSRIERRPLLKAHGNLESSFDDELRGRSHKPILQVNTSVKRFHFFMLSPHVLFLFWEPCLGEEKFVRKHVEQDLTILNQEFPNCFLKSST